MSPEEQPIVIHPELQGEVDTVGPMVPTPPVSDPASEPPQSPEAARMDLLTVRQAVSAAAAAAVRPAVGTARRALSLDALRGLFLVSMTLGFTLRGDFLPLWMYHRQMPPPDYSVVPIAGISWRDLAYGAFLFTMAAAFPLTLSKRIARGETELGIVFASVKRYVLLLCFAILVGHSNNYFMGYTQTTRALAVVGFGIMALVFTRRRADWDEARYRLVRRAGWVAALAFVSLSPLLYGSTFSFQRIDDIIAGLAFVALFGSIAWYFTRDNLPARLGILAGVVALHLGALESGWLQDWWEGSPAPWAFVPSRAFLLTVAIPGTIAGDALLKWMHAPQAAEQRGWKPIRLAAVSALTFAFTPLVVVGMYNRAVQTTTQVVLAMVLGGLFLTARPVTHTERLLQSLFRWGAVWLVLGLFMEPFEGGIKKAPETLSYFFVVAGLTTLLLASLTALVSGLGRQRWVRLLVDVGHNPLLAYVVFSVLMNSALEMIPPLRGVLRDSTGEVILRTLLETTAAMLIVRAATKRRIYWRT